MPVSQGRTRVFPDGNRRSPGEDVGMQLGEESRDRSGSERPTAEASSHRTRTASPSGNARLTAMTGAVLLILFSAEVLTTLLMGSLFGLHFFLGMLLIGPVCLKI